MLAACRADEGSSKLADSGDAGGDDVRGDGAAGSDGIGPDASADGSGGDDANFPPDQDDLPDLTGADALADATGAPAGTACVTDGVCNSGWCVPSAIGQVCVDICVERCGPGLACIPAAESGTDPINLCVPFETPPGPDTVGGDTSDDSGSPSDVVTPDGGPDDDGVVTDAGPGPDVPGEETIGGDPDSDGDGIPDDEDNLPCLAVYLVVYNQDVSSASIHLNGSEVVGANTFPTAEPITIAINPATGENTLALGGQLTGSPTDTLTLVVVDSDGRIYFATVIAREPGKPTDHSYTFEIDVTCP